MIRLIFLMLLIVASEVDAENSDIVIAYGTGNTPVNSSIDIDAEYIAIAVTLLSDAKYPSERVKLINELQSIVSVAATKIANIKFKQGAISLTPSEISSFSVSRSYRGSSSSLYLLAKIDSNKGIYDATQELYSFINNIKKPKGTSVKLGSTALAISSPNQYRDKLLTLVKEEIVSAKTVLGEGYRVSVFGLENPVVVKQKNDIQVTLFFDYRIELNE